MGRQDVRQKTNGETRCKTKKIGLPDRDKKKWGDKTQDQKNGETRIETKKIGR